MCPKLFDILSEDVLDLIVAEVAKDAGLEELCEMRFVCRDLSYVLESKLFKTATINITRPARTEPIENHGLREWGECSVDYAFKSPKPSSSGKQIPVYPSQESHRRSEEVGIGTHSILDGLELRRCPGGIPTPETTQCAAPVRNWLARQCSTATS